MGCRVWGVKCGVCGVGCRAWGVGCRAYVAGCRVQRVGFAVQGVGEISEIPPNPWCLSHRAQDGPRAVHRIEPHLDHVVQCLLCQGKLSRFGG